MIRARPSLVLRAAPLILLVLAGCGASQPLALSPQELSAIKAASRDDRAPSPAIHARVAEAHAEWPERTLAAIGAGEITPGMTREQVVYAWGLPSRRMNPIFADAATERWWYRQVSPGIELNFRDQRLESAHAEWTPDEGPEPGVPRGEYGYRLATPESR